jgi:hypothetical protein
MHPACFRYSRLWLLCLALIVVGCRAQPQNVPASTPAPGDEGYPGPDSLATAIAPTSVVLTIPEPSDVAGVVTGQLVDTAGKPYVGTLYLGKAIYSNQPEMGPVISFSEQDPRAILDPATGTFVQGDVVPGEYGLVLWTPVGSNVITDPTTGEHFLFEVVAGQVTDLGSITVE